MQAQTGNLSRRIILAHDPTASFRELVTTSANIVPAANIVAAAEGQDLYLMLKPTGVHWVIAFLSPDGQMPAALDALIMKYPHIPILAVAADGNPTEMKWMEFPSELLVGVPFDELTAGLYTVYLSNLMQNLVPNFGTQQAVYADALSQSIEGAYPGW